MNRKLFDKYRQILPLLNRDFLISLVDRISEIKGFLCNFQIPIVYLISNDIEGEIAEIGVWYGRNTLAFCCANPHIKINCIDTFLGSSEHQDELKGKNFKEDFLNNLRKYQPQNHINVIEAPSVSAATLFPDNSLDLVWIDAGHDYESVKSDILAWYPKLKVGKMMLGHDYADPKDPNGGFEELVKAVNENVRDSGRFENFDSWIGIWGAKKL